MKLIVMQRVLVLSCAALASRFGFAAGIVPDFDYKLTPCLAARAYAIPLEKFEKADVDLASVTGIFFSARWAEGLDAHICNVRLLTTRRRCRRGVTGWQI